MNDTGTAGAISPLVRDLMLQAFGEALPMTPSGTHSLDAVVDLIAANGDHAPSPADPTPPASFSRVAGLLCVLVSGVSVLTWQMI